MLCRVWERLCREDGNGTSPWWPTGFREAGKTCSKWSGHTQNSRRVNSHVYVEMSSQSGAWEGLETRHSRKESGGPWQQSWGSGLGCTLHGKLWDIFLPWCKCPDGQTLICFSFCVQKSQPQILKTTWGLAHATPHSTTELPLQPDKTPFVPLIQHTNRTETSGGQRWSLFGTFCSTDYKCIYVLLSTKSSGPTTEIDTHSVMFPGLSEKTKEQLSSPTSIRQLKNKPQVPSHVVDAFTSVPFQVWAHGLETLSSGNTASPARAHSLGKGHRSTSHHTVPITRVIPVQCTLRSAFRLQPCCPSFTSSNPRAMLQTGWWVRFIPLRSLAESMLGNSLLWCQPHRGRAALLVKRQVPHWGERQYGLVILKPCHQGFKAALLPRDLVP